MTCVVTMEQKRSAKELVKRYIIMICGLYLTALSVALSVSSNLGTSPISTIPNVFSYKFTDLSLGVLMFIWNVILLVGQVIVLRKNFKIYQLLQLPLSFLFSAMIDLNNKYIIANLPIESMFSRILVLVIGCVMLGFAVTLTMKSDVVMNSGEAIVKAVSDTFGFNFGNVKVCFDVSYVIIGAVASLIMFRTLKGVGAGTIFMAVCTGFVVKFFVKILGNRLDRFFA